MNNKEIWRPIKGYEGLYEISNTRRIKSLERISSNGKLIRGKEKKKSNNNGYEVILLIDKNYNRKIHYVDKLMYDNFKKEERDAYE